MVVIGFVLNRMNITLTGLEGWAGVSYFPSWMELAVTFSIVAFGFVVFALAAKYLPIFKHEEHPHHALPHNEWNEDLKMVSQLQ
jgi:Ni/Fe-hydrogenase subunit HybB-like protein